MAKETTIPGLLLVRQYLKYANFESKILPSDAVAKATSDATVNIDVSVRATNFQEDVYEVVVDILASSVAPNGRELFVLDISYAGVFGVSNAQPEDLEMILLIYCPGIIYPFAREAVYSLSVSGGFPPLMLDLIDFSKLYYEQNEQKEAAKEKK
ncbi:MAG: protein-export chaperone SecB [Alphaproteobacteria bacterium]|nr:protein-export chaperone SecB [Rickettsiales bacterium]